MLDTTVPAANSALQRARATMRQHEPAGSTSGSTAEEQQLLDRFVHAHEAGDAEAAIAIAASDIRVTMPPTPMCFEGIDAIAPLLERALGPERDGDWKLIPTRANRMPAAASYLRRPGDSLYRAFKLDVLWIAHSRVAQITTFRGRHDRAVRSARDAPAVVRTELNGDAATRCRTSRGRSVVRRPGRGRGPAPMVANVASSPVAELVTADRRPRCLV